METADDPAWRALVDAALRFRKLAPWNWVSDDELCGARRAADGEVFYCSVLGAAQEIYGLVVHRGAAGFAVHAALRRSRRRDPSEMARKLDGYVAEFVTEEELEAADRELLERCRVTMRGGGCPVFRCNRPGYAPRPLVAAEEALELELALGAATVDAALARRELSSGGCQRPRSQIPVYTRAADGSFARRIEREPAIGRASTAGRPLDDLQAARIDRATTKPAGVWQLATFSLPIMVGDSGDAEIPAAVLLVDAASGMVLEAAIVDAETDVVQAAREKLIAALERSGSRPAELEVMNRESKASVKAVCEQLGIEVKVGKSMRALTAAKKSLLAGLAGGAPLAAATEVEHEDRP